MPSPSALLLAASQQVGVQPVQTANSLRSALPRVQENPFDFASYVDLYR